MPTLQVQSSPPIPPISGLTKKRRNSEIGGLGGGGGGAAEKLKRYAFNRRSTDLVILKKKCNFSKKDFGKKN